MAFGEEDAFPDRRREAQRQASVTTTILKLFSEKSSRKAYLDAVVEQIRDWSQCSCVGIRVLNEDGYIPYESYVGFSRDFWESENLISPKQDRCVCVRVISGEEGPRDHQCLSEGGSFYCNDTLALVGSLSEAEREAFRGVCMQRGYKSLAVVPVFDQTRVVGAIHVADPLDGKVPVSVVRFLESISPLIGEALRRFSVEDALALANSYNRNLIETSPDPLVTISQEGKISDVNTATERATGLTREELIGTDFCDYFTDPKRARAGYQLVFREGVVQDYELEIRHRDSHVTPVLYNASVYKDANGKVLGVFAAARDISTRKAMEKALRESENRYRTLVEQMPAVVYTRQLDETRRVLYMSPQVKSMLGCDYREFLDDPNLWFSMIHPDDGQWVAERVWDTLRTKTPFAADYRMITPAGNVVWCHDDASVVRDDKGRPQFLQGIVYNITERKRAEDERLRLMQAVEQIEESIVISDRDWRIQYVNPAFSRMRGYGYHEIMGKDLLEIVGAWEAPSFIEGLRKKLLAGETWKGHTTGEDQHGTEREIEIAILPVFDVRGDIVNYVAVEHDVTENVKLERQLSQSLKMEAIGTLAGGIAHDFNNILAGIIGFTEMVLEDVPSDGPIQRRLELALKGARRGRDLVKQILTFSRKGNQEKRALSMCVILDEVFPLVRASLPATIDIKKTVLARSDTVLVDSTQMHQVILNLCSNAAHAMREKGGFLEITLAEECVAADERSLSMEQKKPGDYLRLSIADTGCGIKADDLERIFDPFFTTKSSGEGTGLGLSVVHGIVKGHEGYIDVVSKPGEGAVFHILLPREDTSALSDNQKDKSVRGGTESILVVDDEEMLIEMSKQRLERLGYIVTGSTDCAEALEMFRKSPDGFDLVVTDYTMPQMTGLDLAKELISIRPDVPIIMCSGFNESVPMEKVKETGIRGFFAKPIGKDDFAILVRNALDERQEITGNPEG